MYLIIFTIYHDKSMSFKLKRNNNKTSHRGMQIKIMINIQNTLNTFKFSKLKQPYIKDTSNTNLIHESNMKIQ